MSTARTAPGAGGRRHRDEHERRRQVVDQVGKDRAQSGDREQVGQRTAAGSRALTAEARPLSLAAARSPRGRGRRPGSRVPRRARAAPASRSARNAGMVITAAPAAATQTGWIPQRAQREARQREREHREREPGQRRTARAGLRDGAGVRDRRRRSA